MTAQKRNNTLPIPPNTGNNGNTLTFIRVSPNHHGILKEISYPTTEILIFNLLHKYAKFLQ